MILNSSILSIAESNKDVRGSKPMTISFYNKKGELIDLPDCMCTSLCYNNRTINVQCVVSTERRTIRVFSIVKLNGMEVIR